MKFNLWPIPALLAWSSSWLIFIVLIRLGAPEVVGLVVATLWSGALTMLATTTMRRALVVLGFPLSMLAGTGGFNLPPWAWLALLAVIFFVYPMSAWRDAPLFPTPKRALRLLPETVDLGNKPRILDAGSGMGDGLIALKQAYPRADLHGLEMSWPLRLLSAMRCPWARIRQGDIWIADWRSYDMVYMFQRPESMPRAVEKAEAELRPGAWLVSLEFEARDIVPVAVIEGKDSRPVWMYQLPFKRRT
jgi:hypothetical protein